MAATSFSRSRSPVMSIHTQPEEESNLRAEIEAASRTQHEILPRYSWHLSFIKRDSSNALRQTYPPVLQREPPPPIQSARLSTLGPAQDHDQASLTSRPAISDTLSLKRSPETRKPWRQFTRRSTKADASPHVPVKTRMQSNQDKQGKRRGKTVRACKQADEVVACEDRAAQHAQFNAWLEERLEEQNTLGDLTQPLPSKTKWALRKSVYGSLSSTKRLFRTASKSPLEKICDRGAINVATTPHVYSFETKDHLRDYLSNASMLSPMSPLEQLPQVINVPQGIEPVELSAGPLPAELEGTTTNATAEPRSAVPDTSTPSVRDLPPYIDEKKYCTDMAKERGLSPCRCMSQRPKESPSSAEVLYICSSCQKQINNDEIYDFCSICDTGDRILCTGCAERGPCCRHELEDLFRSCASSQEPLQPQESRGRGTERQNIAAPMEPLPTTQPNTHQRHGSTEQPDASTISELVGTTSSDQGPQERGSNIHAPIVAETKNVKLGLLTEMGYLQREQELVHRERELALRAREIEIRDQHTTLRQREAIMQQKSDLLIRNLETLVSYRDLTKSAFIGAQFQPQPNDDVHENDTKKTYSSKRATKGSSISLKCCEHPHQHRAVVAKAVEEAEASMQDTISDNTHIKSYGAQKRKKEGSSDSTISTPATAPSPQQQRKVLSRGNSERGASQDEEDDDDGNRRVPKKYKQEPPSPNGTQRLFACPYSKNDPTRFSSRNMQEKNYRGCGTHYLPDVSRLKQHLKRVHWQPEAYCPRCYEEFEDSAGVAEHARAFVACTAKPCPFPEKMDKTQQDRIHVKRPRVHPETVWFDIYKVLFPGSPLPDSPYVEDDRIITPLSATPQSAINVQATQMLSNIFNKRLNRCEELQHNPFRPVIQQALADSFSELLGAFSLSPTASPGAGPSIVVSPVSRSSSDTTRVLDSPTLAAVMPPKHERQRSVTTVISQPQQVPRLQHPRPPRPKVNTALQVPHDLHRSPSNHSRPESFENGSPADVVFDINVLPHIQDDPGYDDECRSFEKGDDQEAMAFVDESAPPAFRNKSVMSIDSGYGSSKSSRHLNSQTLIPAPTLQTFERGYDNGIAIQEANQLKYHEQQLPAAPVLNKTSDPLANQHLHRDEYSFHDFESYSDFLDPTSQEDMFNGLDYPLMGHDNPWSYP